MRQVRKPRQPGIRQQLKRAQTRGGRREPAKPFGKRDKPPGGIKGRLFAWLKSLFSIRRPMFLMTFMLTMLMLVVAVALSGVVGRTQNGIEKMLADGAADAGFTIRTVQVSGLLRTPEESVHAALGLKPGQQMIGLDLFAARARLKQLPWVADATVRRRFPGAIEVQLTEKQPYARWRGAGRVFVVERSGSTITDRGIEAFARLPLLDGAGAPQSAATIVEEVSRRPEVKAQVAMFQYQSERRWNLVLKNGVTVKLPEDGWARQLDTLRRLIVDGHIFQYNLVEIDLRSKTHFFFRNGRKPAEAPSAEPLPVQATKGRAI